MKRKNLLKTTVYLLLALCLLLTACSSGTETPSTTAPDSTDSSAPAATAAPDGQESTGEQAATTSQLVVSPAGIVQTSTTMTGAPQAEEQRLVYNNIESSSYDPIRNENMDELSSHMFEGLTCWTQGELTMGQAESIDVSEDGLTYTVTMRDDIYWSDGEPVTAYDFEWSWLRHLDPATAGKYTRMLYPIKNAQAYNAGECTADEVGLECPDERTLIITLEAPQLVFTEILAMREYMPVRQDIVETYGEAWSLDPETCIGNGPFKMKELIPGEKIVYEKNPYYYDADQVILEEIECRFITDPSVELMSYEAGEIKIATQVSAESCLLHPDQSYIIQRLSSMWLVVDCEDDVLSDVRVRKALAMSFDRQAICDAVFKGAEQPSYTIIPNGMKDPITGEPWSAYGQYFEENVAEAQALLAEAGYPNGEGFPTLTFGTSTSTENEQVAQAITAMWKANLGINCEIKVEDSASFIAHRQEGAFDIARWTNTGGYNDPTNYLAYYESDQPNNDSHYSNPEYDALLHQANAEADIPTRMEMLHQLDEMLITDMAVIPLYNPAQKYLIDPSVVGAGVSPAGSLDFKRAYIAAE